MKLATCTRCGEPRRSLTVEICARCRKHPKDACPDCGEPKGVDRPRCRRCAAPLSSRKSAAKRTRSERIPPEKRLAAMFALPAPDGDWRPVPTWDGYYEATSDGRVRRLPRIVEGADGKRRLWRGGLLKPVLDMTGYLTVTLHGQGRRERLGLHVIVAWAFLGVRSTRKRPINHIDGNKRNCRVDNLESVTGAENAQHARATGLYVPRRGDGAPGVKLADSDVKAIRALHGILTQAQIAERFGVTRKYVEAIQSRRARSHVP